MALYMIIYRAFLNRTTLFRTKEAKDKKTKHCGKIQTFLSENALNKGFTEESLDLWENLNFWILPQCRLLQNPPYSESFIFFLKMPRIDE